MSYSNRLLESTSTKVIEGIPRVGFKLTPDGNYDMNYKKLVNIKYGINNNDAINKKQLEDYVDSKITDKGGIDLNNHQRKDRQIVLSTDINANNKK